MSEYSQSSSPDNNTPEDSPSSENVSVILRNFLYTFKSMLTPLEFCLIKDADGQMRELEKSDIETYRNDLIKFSEYIRYWEENNIDTSTYIMSTKGLRQYLRNIVGQFTLAMKVYNRTGQAEDDMIQFDKGNEIYLIRLGNCRDTINEMLDKCFKIRY